MTEPRHIINPALRIARLAALNAPAVILLDQADTLLRRVEAMYREIGEDPAEWRASKAVFNAEPVEPLTADEVAEMERDEAEMAAADRKARERAGYSEVEWRRLDYSYRFGLILDELPAPSPAHPDRSSA